jgi:predicted amidohydrolase
LFHKLRENAVALGIQKTGDGEDGISSLSWNTSSGEVRWIKNSLDGLSDSLLSRAVLDLIEERLGDQYNKLNSFFRPNVGVPPLPAPFCIDLTEPERGAGQPSKPVVEVYDFGLDRPARIRVALPWLGVPLRFYNTASGRLLDANRAEVEHAARGLVAAAVEERASVLVLPEYILPRTVAPELCTSAAEAGLVLISGVEGQAGGEDSRLLNEALIQLPDQPQPFSQPKRHPSVYERPLVSSGKVKLFKGTSLGTFGVIVCSDLLDWQVVDAFADSRWHVDVLFVCSCNPNFEIYEHLAVADAWRFYRHVVVVNNCMERDETKASGNGTLISSPKVPPVTRFNEVKEKRDIGVPPIGGCQPQIAIVELSIQGLTTDRVKPTDGLGAFPPSRNVQTVGRP